MKLIGAGLPRTATTTQMIALEMLGLPCYHMRDMMADPAKSVPQWRQAFEGNGPWDELFAGKESIVDWPGSYHWRELMDVYPDAKVLLSVRSAESWVESMQNTIAQIFVGDTLLYHLAQAQYQIDPVYAAWLDVLRDMWLKADIMVGKRGRPRGDGRRDGALEPGRHRRRARGAPPGVEPKGRLGAALRVPRGAVPEQPLPHVNDVETFQKVLIIGPAMAALNEWWEREKPPAQ